VSKFFSFPDPVNEVSARVVAGGVVVLCLLTLSLRSPVLLVVLAYGFVARVAAGPRFSPLGLLATKVITPRLSLAPKYVPGPPKRFAQAIGAALSLGAAALAFGFGLTTVAYICVAAIAVAATLESVFGYCIGCKIFAVLMHVGIIPPEVCERCTNLQARPQH
jgi:hypothetical protein